MIQTSSKNVEQQLQHRGAFLVVAYLVWCTSLASGASQTGFGRTGTVDWHTSH